MKWATPLTSCASLREPILSQIPREMDLTCGICSVRIVSPLSKTSLWMLFIEVDYLLKIDLTWIFDLSVAKSE